jgi:hypothetical protein
MSDLLKIAGLWKVEKDGKTYLSGSLGPGVKILVLRNQFKKEPKHPDYNVFLCQAERKKTERRPEPEPPPNEEMPF